MGLSGSLGGGFMAQNVVGVRQAANVLQRATVILGIAFGLLTLFISLQVGAGGTTERSILRENVSSQLPVLEGTGQAQEGEQVPLFPADTSESQ
jgi:preprotein translocase subunit SecG